MSDLIHPIDTLKTAFVDAVNQDFGQYGPQIIESTIVVGEHVPIGPEGDADMLPPSFIDAGVKSSMVVITGDTQSSTEKRRLTYNRLNIADLPVNWQEAAVITGDTLPTSAHQILDLISQACGMVVTEDDIEDSPIDYFPQYDEYEIEIRAKPGSVGYYGELSTWGFFSEGVQNAADNLMERPLNWRNGRTYALGDGTIVGRYGIGGSMSGGIYGTGLDDSAETGNIIANQTRVQTVVTLSEPLSQPDPDDWRAGSTTARLLFVYYRDEETPETIEIASFPMWTFADGQYTFHGDPVTIDYTFTDDYPANDAAGGELVWEAVYSSGMKPDGYSGFNVIEINPMHSISDPTPVSVSERNLALRTTGWETQTREYVGMSSPGVLSLLISTDHWASGDRYQPASGVTTGDYVIAGDIVPGDYFEVTVTNIDFAAENVEWSDTAGPIRLIAEALVYDAIDNTNSGVPAERIDLGSVTIGEWDEGTQTITANTQDRQIRYDFEQGYKNDPNVRQWVVFNIRIVVGYVSDEYGNYPSSLNAPAGSLEVRTLGHTVVDDEPAA